MIMFRNISTEDHIDLSVLLMHSSDRHESNASKTTRIRLWMAKKQPKNETKS